ncbi:methyltransferase family protein [Labedaea rhizosphaerae]|uniref:Methyltransferase family protein n=1 Tax=Labedaea rhizosphaerae TaxID=598644 RepID=A0A4R6SHG6_LABRH|nr:methyltransferase family protein [Labedaea rhizosphaerae]
MGKYGDRLFVSTEAERQRLASLELAYDQGSFDTLSQVAIKTHWHCLELGAGAGSVARWLAAQVPDGMVTATDIDTRFLGDLQAENVRVRRHDLVTEEFPEATFDLIHARLLLSHLPERANILRKLFRWLKPGGVLVVEGMCWYPVNATENDVYRTGMNAYDKATATLVGTDSSFMQRLPALLGELGYVDVGVDLHGHVVQGGTPVADMWRRTVAMSRERAIEAGLATHADFDAFEELMHDPTFFGHGPVMAGTWGYRPEQV